MFSQFPLKNKLLSVTFLSYNYLITYAVNSEGVFMGPTQGHYILQLCMGPSYFWRGLTPPEPPLFRTLLDGLTE